MSHSLLLLAGFMCAQAPDDKALQASAREQADQCLKWFIAGEFDKIADKTYPPFVKLIGGKEKWIQILEDRADDLKADEMDIVRAEALPAKEIHKAGKDLVAFIPIRVQLQSPDGGFMWKDHLIALSADHGKTWLFMERGEREEEEIRKLYPQLPKTVALPREGECEKIKSEAKDGVFTSQKGNFKISYPKEWKPAEGGRGLIGIVLEREKQMLMLHGQKSNTPAHEMLEDFLMMVKGASKGPKEHRRDKMKIGGVEATFVHMEGDREKDRMDVWVTTFHKQGISYRLLAFGPRDKSPDLEKSFFAVAKSFSFLGERKEWLATHEGKPARTAFLGGLASIELNRPRWREITFDRLDRFDPSDPSDRLDDSGASETLRFEMHNGGATIKVSAHPGKTSAKIELDELQHSFSQRLDKFQAKRLLLKGSKGGLMAGVEMTGIAGRTPFVVLGTVIVKNEVAVHLTLECLASARSEFQKDWDQLVREFRLEDAKTQTPLFPSRDTERQRPHAALATLLKKATVIYPGHRLHEVHSISADGQQALLVVGRDVRDGATVENLIDRKRTPVSAERPLYGVPATWSKDGKQLAYATTKGFLVHTLGGRGGTEVRIRVHSLAFTPEDELLLATQPNLDENRPAGSRFVQHKLVRWEEEGEAPKTLLEFPLARFAHLAVSPDGKQLALVTNKDSRRTSHRPGHLYVANPDGSGLRQLTKESETIRSVAWSEDGRSLLVVRRFTHDDDPLDYRPGGDLYRISVETGQALNLTRCGKIDQAWVQGEHVLLRIAGSDVPFSQTGIYKVALEDLIKASAKLPEPQPGAPKDQAKKIAAKIKAAMAPQSIGEIVPTPEILDKLARAFADAATEVLGERFDFSAASLDSLPRWADWLEPALASEPAVVFGLGAYYGETLRKVGKAEWRLQRVPFGDWLPGRSSVYGNSVVQIVLPFSEIYRYSMRSGRDYLRAADMLLADRGQKIVLVYPPALAEKALREATPKGYLQAQEALDKGELKTALDLLGKELRNQPKNTALALDVLDLCETVRMPAVADELAKLAAEAGSETPEILVRHADSLAKTDPDKAVIYYRKAVQAPFVRAEVYVKLGKHLAAAGDRALADCCFRRAYLAANDRLRDEIRGHLGMPKAPRYRDDFRDDGK